MAYPGPFPFKVEQGGTGDTSVTANAVVIGDTADQLTSTNVGTNGQVLIGATSAAPEFATLTSTGGTITFTTGANSLNLEAVSSGSSSSVVFTALADTGTISPGQLVFVNGISAGTPVVKLADCLGTSPGHWPAAGMAIDTITTVASGRILVSGVATNVDTSTFLIGDRLFLSGTPGVITRTRPTGNNATQPVGIALTGGANPGKVLMNIVGNVTLIPNLLANFIPVGLNGGTDYPTSVSLANGLLTYDTTGQAFSGSSITQNSLIYGSTSNTVANLGVATNGQIPIGSTSNPPVLATITAGTGISVTNGAGSITINNTASGLAFVDVTGTTQAMASNTIYLADNAGLVTLTLPASATQGTIIRIVGNGAGGWTVAQNAGQSINIGSDSTTVGVGGSLASTQRYDAIEILCSVTDTRWNVMSSQGNITVV